MLLVPMLISVDELLRVKRHVLDIQQELRQKGSKSRPAGLMIKHLPVMLCQELAAEADFSVSAPNDLTHNTP